MHTLRTQIEIRFSTIINFRDIYKSIIAPYAKLCKWEIFNSGMYEEYIHLNFPEFGYIIDVRWDRLVFVIDGKPENLYSSTGPTLYFLNILEKLKEHQEFGNIVNFVVAEWGIVEYDCTTEKVLRNFYGKYLKEPHFKVPDFEDDDVSISYDLKKDQTILKVQFGVFKKEKDILQYKITPISSNFNKEVFELNGLFVHTSLFEVSEKVDISKLRGAALKLVDVISQIK